jgi:hypothetical protein
MFFGQKQQFAIEAMIEPSLTSPSTPWGRMRVWCDGVPFGDYSNQHCGLPASHFKDLARDLPSLWSPDFDGLNDADLFRRLDGLLYSCQDGAEIVDERALEELEKDARRYGRFVFLTNWEEMFDNEGKAFIFCPDGNLVKILHQAHQGDRCATLMTSIQEVLTACEDFEVWFSKQTERLQQVL